MPYIGKEPAVGNFVKLDAISTSSTNSYSLTLDSVAFVPESANHMLVSLNGVIQAPLTSFSVSGSTITFLPSSGTLSSSDSIDFIMVYGNVLDIGTPSDSTVTNAKTNFVTTSSAAGLQIKGDNTTAGALQLNCEQNSHGIKLQSPPHSANQSYTLKFPSGNVTAGKFLKVDSVSGSGTTGVGTMTFSDAGGGGTTFLYATSGSSASSVSVSSTYITTTHDLYLFHFSGKMATDNANIRGRFLDSSGGEISSNYKINVSRVGNDGLDYSATGSYFDLNNSNGIGNAANEGFNIVGYLQNPTSNTITTSFDGFINFSNTGDSARVEQFSMKRADGTEQHYGFKFYPNSGNFAEFKITVHGFNKS